AADDELFARGGAVATDIDAKCCSARLRDIEKPIGASIAFDVRTVGISGKAIAPTGGRCPVTAVVCAGGILVSAADFVEIFFKVRVAIRAGGGGVGGAGGVQAVSGFPMIGHTVAIGVPAGGTA